MTTTARDDHSAGIDAVEIRDDGDLLSMTISAGRRSRTLRPTCSATPFRPSRLTVAPRSS